MDRLRQKLVDDVRKAISDLTTEEAILSAAMLLRHSLEMEAEARAVETAVAAVLDAGHRTPDIVPCPTLGPLAPGQRVRCRVGFIELVRPVRSKPSLD